MFQEEKETALAELSGAGSDYVAVYMALGRLMWISETRPRVLDLATVDSIKAMLERQEHISKKTSFFLYKKAAHLLSGVLVRHPDPGLARKALKTLTDLLPLSGGVIHRAVTDALGTLPVSLPRPEFIEPPTPEDLPEVTWKSLCLAGGLSHGKAPLSMGRSLVFPLGSRVLVVKCAQNENQARGLDREAAWMLHLAEKTYPEPFSIPDPLMMNKSFINRVQDLPLPPGKPRPYCCLAFFAGPEYFSYPNEPSAGKGNGGAASCRRILEKAARLFGHMAARGVVHTAPIPLFHNRAQAFRRNDRGLYQWPRAGRLDQWLSSCLYPNFGASGIRDFEHMEVFTASPRDLYLRLGTHILGMVLVAGSYFRNQDPGRAGMGADGTPCDARDLFDPEALHAMVKGIFRAYFLGFCGRPFTGPEPFDCHALVSELIEKMGQDTDMEEVFRTQDQKSLDRPEFIRFLTDRGYPLERANRAEQGKEDIPLFTGPHLGGFNDRISTPRLIEYVAAATGLCIANRYMDQKNLQPAPMRDSRSVSMS